MADVRMISLRTVLEDYADFTGEELQLKESVILKIAKDTASQIITDEQLDHKIALIDVKEYQAILPDTFKFVVQAGCVVEKNCNIRREEIVEFTKQIHGTDCKMKINLECPTCHKDSCNCNTDIIIVEADQMWKDAHPEHNVGHAKHFWNYGKTDTYGNMLYHPKFHLMKRSSNNFFSTPYHIPHCVNLNFDSEHEYNIDLPKIITNFRTGIILLSYLGQKVDKDGYPLIPDHPQVTDAIFYAIAEKDAWLKFSKTGEARYNTLVESARSKKLQATRAAVNALGIPNADEFFQFLENHWTKWIPYWDHKENYNRNKKDTWRTPEH
jgi:hypothetical protein